MRGQETIERKSCELLRCLRVRKAREKKEGYNSQGIFNPPPHNCVEQNKYRKSYFNIVVSVVYLYDSKFCNWVV